jgi:cytochrome c554/c'-like protein
VGREVCSKCHSQKSRSQSHTAMAHALADPSESTVLGSHPQMTFRAGPYVYEILNDGQQRVFTVSDGKQTIREPIAYAFGNGHVAQTYVLRRNGKLYEGRVSYYSGIDGLDWTLGDALNPPPSLEEAFGRDITSDEARNCFSCHGTAAVVDNRLQLDRLLPGVGCEACHGPGARHAAAMASGTGDELYIFNPKTLAPDTLSQEFCGACHRSANTVGMMPDLGGIANVRFQPYRIANSRGHDTGDARLACTACHDPHVDLKSDPAAYDSKCTTCHAKAPAGQPGRFPDKHLLPTLTPKPCPVGSESCVTCHMPKIELPGAHFKFTDHRIRVMRAGDRYPY